MRILFNTLLPSIYGFKLWIWRIWKTNEYIELIINKLLFYTIDVMHTHRNTEKKFPHTLVHVFFHVAQKKRRRRRRVRSKQVRRGNNWEGKMDQSILWCFHDILIYSEDKYCEEAKGCSNWSIGKTTQNLNTLGRYLVCPCHWINSAVHQHLPEKSWLTKPPATNLCPLRNP